MGFLNLTSLNLRFHFSCIVVPIFASGFMQVHASFVKMIVHEFLFVASDLHFGLI